MSSPAPPPRPSHEPPPERAPLLPSGTLIGLLAPLNMLLLLVTALVCGAAVVAGGADATAWGGFLLSLTALVVVWLLVRIHDRLHRD